MNALAGVALAPVLLDEAIKQGEEDPRYRRMLDERIAAFTSEIRSRAMVPAAPPSGLQQRPEIAPYASSKENAQ